MAVGTFEQPNFETQTGTVYKTSIDNSIMALARIGQMFAPHEEDTPAMTVRLDAGALWVSGAIVEKAAQSTGTITAPTTHPRIDRLVIDNATGVVSVIPGEEADTPSPPVITTGKLPVAQVLLQTTSTVITNDMITDERILGGGGGGEAFPVNSVYTNQGTIVELGYGTWAPLICVNSNSVYPPAQNDTYVKATSYFSTNFHPYYMTDPTKSLTGDWNYNQWLAGPGWTTNQRFHIDLGTPLVIARIYYENAHKYGGDLDAGAKNFTLWGSNDAAAFSELTYNIDTGWTQIGGAFQFEQHIAADQADPKFINVVPNGAAYRYYALKIADGWGSSYMGVRRIELWVTDCVLWKRTA
jgi:hypothetical protein